MNNYNYHPGTDTPDAPWNETSMPEREFKFDVRQTMHLADIVTTNKYDAYRDDEDGHVEIDTFDTPWQDIFEDQYYGIEALLAMLKKYVQKDLRRAMKKAENDKHRYAFDIRRLQGIIDECNLWYCEDTDIEANN